MSFVFVLDTSRKPMAPVHPGQARRLLAMGRAAVFRHFPFTIILSHTDSTTPTGLRLKLDPGSRVTGLALLDDARGLPLVAAELEHRGIQITAGLHARKALRRARRQRKTRYRPVRYANRRRRPGWLPPSIESRVANVLTWVQRLQRLAPISMLSVELARFDTQALQQPEIAGVKYQRGELAGYEVREYLLEKWGHRCAYCDNAGVPLQIDHIVSRAQGGSDRVSNLTLACRRCNQRKGSQPVSQFLAHDRDRLNSLLTQARVPLRDAAAINTIQATLAQKLQATGLPIEVGTGAMTKWNRARLSMPKTHWLDAVCVGKSTPDCVDVRHVRALTIRATGHGHRQRARTDRYGFPVAHRTGQKTAFGFRTGDMVRAVIGRDHAERVVGRVTIRVTPKFQVNGRRVHPKRCIKLHSADGYTFELPGASSARRLLSGRGVSPTHPSHHSRQEEPPTD
jgi:5-methylcytosine-specific restriction endonuclease McrA